jgi:outer membrane lipoprotein SlyB
MLKAFRNLASAAILTLGLTGCVGTAGVSTWEYQAGQGYETERVYDGRIQADTSQGVTREACRTVSRRQIGPSGDVVGGDVTACASN